MGQAHQDQLGTGTALMALGHLGVVQGDFAAARQRLVDGLACAASITNERGIQQCLELLAWIALSESAAQRAARLLGAAETMRERLGVDLDAPLQPRHAATLAALQQALDAPVLSACWDQGRHLTVAQSVALGLQEIGDAEGGGAKVLTRRERQVTRLIARGLRNREIAAELVISERTAEGHVEQIRRKLGMHTRGQTASWARQHGLDSEGRQVPETGT